MNGLLILRVYILFFYGPTFLLKLQIKNILIFYISRWQENLAVYGISGVILLAVFGLIILEKLSFFPKPLTTLSSFASNNKIILQIMATANVLALLACVIVPLVSI